MKWIVLAVCASVMVVAMVMVAPWARAAEAPACRTVKSFLADMAAPPVVAVIDDVKVKGDRFDEMLVLGGPDGNQFIRFALGGCMIGPTIAIGTDPLPLEYPSGPAPSVAPAPKPDVPDVSA